MPVEQRIIGGGLLIVGIAVVLILIYFFALGGPSPTEAYEQINRELYPAYAEAERKGDYLGMKRRAQEIVDLMDSAGRAGVLKYFEGEAMTSKDAKRVRDLIKGGGFEKNAEGRYEFEGGWFEDKAHRALVRLKGAVENMKILRQVRDVARKANEALDLARTASGHAIPLPAVKAVPTDDAPIVRPNPIYQSDVHLFRVFGVKPTDVEAALATPAGGAGKARSARLRWNNEIPSSNLPTDVQNIPDRVQELRDIASTIERSTRELKGNADARAKLEANVAAAVVVLAGGLAAEHRATFEEHRAKFADGMAVAQVLRKEADMLNEHLTTVRLLGKTFGRTFK